MKYNEAVLADINNYFELDDIREDLAGVEDLDEVESIMNDYLWTCDAITGNASGSYFCNSYEAREAVMEDMETVKDALREFCVEPEKIGEAFLNEDWEYLDVTARCYVLSEAISDYVSENEEAIRDYIAHI